MKKKDNFGGVPRVELECFAHSLLASVQRYYESEVGQRAYAEFEKSQKTMTEFFETDTGAKCLDEFDAFFNHPAKKETQGKN